MMPSEAFPSMDYRRLRQIGKPTKSYKSPKRDVSAKLRSPAHPKLPLIVTKEEPVASTEGVTEFPLYTHEYRK